MYKGKLTIELTNEVTGEKEVHAETNMVTDAVVYLLGLAAQIAAVSSGSYNYMSYLLPVGKKALGGLFLFDGTLEEDADNVHFPMDVHLTGHAGQVANTTGKLAGSINTAESGKTDNGYVNVWDFSTSQANGTIHSIALTHYHGGENPFHWFRPNINTNHTFSLNRPEYPIYCDDETGDVYLYSYNASGTQGKVYKKQVLSYDISVASPTYGEEEEVFDFAFSNPGYSYWTVCPGYDGNVYAINIPQTQNKGSVNIRIRTVNIATGEEAPEKAFQIPNVSAIGSGNVGYDFAARTVISNGYLYFTNYAQNLIYKVNLSNTADVEEISIGDYRNVYYLYPLRGGGIMASYNRAGTNSSGAVAYYGTVALIYEDGEQRYWDSTWSSSVGPYNFIYYISDHLFVPYSYSSTGLMPCINTTYLGTICNLSSPVVKTSAQSMKVTYTLTDVEKDINE